MTPKRKRREIDILTCPGASPNKTPKYRRNQMPERSGAGPSTPGLPVSSRFATDDLSSRPMLGRMTSGYSPNDSLPRPAAPALNRFSEANRHNRQSDRHHDRGPSTPPISRTKAPGSPVPRSRNQSNPATYTTIQRRGSFGGPMKSNLNIDETLRRTIDGSSTAANKVVTPGRLPKGSQKVSTRLKSGQVQSEKERLISGSATMVTGRKGRTSSKQYQKAAALNEMKRRTALASERVDETVDLTAPSPASTPPHDSDEEVTDSSDGEDCIGREERINDHLNKQSSARRSVNRAGIEEGPIQKEGSVIDITSTDEVDLKPKQKPKLKLDRSNRCRRTQTDDSHAKEGKSKTRLKKPLDKGTILSAKPASSFFTVSNSDNDDEINPTDWNNVSNPLVRSLPQNGTNDSKKKSKKKVNETIILDNNDSDKDDDDDDFEPVRPLARPSTRSPSPQPKCSSHLRKSRKRSHLLNHDFSTPPLTFRAPKGAKAAMKIRLESNVQANLSSKPVDQNKSSRLSVHAKQNKMTKGEGSKRHEFTPMRPLAKLVPNTSSKRVGLSHARLQGDTDDSDFETGEVQEVKIVLSKKKIAEEKTAEMQEVEIVSTNRKQGMEVEEIDTSKYIEKVEEINSTGNSWNKNEEIEEIGPTGKTRNVPIEFEEINRSKYNIDVSIQKNDGVHGTLSPRVNSSNDIFDKTPVFSNPHTDDDIPHIGPAYTKQPCIDLDDHCTEVNDLTKDVNSLRFGKTENSGNSSQKDKRKSQGNQDSQENHPNIRLRELDDEEKREYASVTRGAIKSKVLAVIKEARISLCGRDFACLRGCRWLNDEILNSFVALINARNTRHFELAAKRNDPAIMNRTRWVDLKRASNAHDEHSVTRKYGKLFNSGRPRTHVFNTFFFERVTQNTFDYNGVKRWLTKAGKHIKDLDLILFPINLQNFHWVLAAIDLRAQVFYYMDSMCGNDKNDVIGTMKKWLINEVEDKIGEGEASRLGICNFMVAINPGFVPSQSDSGSCGVFTLYLAEYLERGVEPEYEHENMATMRRRAVLFLKNGKLPNDDDE